MDKKVRCKEKLTREDLVFIKIKKKKKTRSSKLFFIRLERFDRIEVNQFELLKERQFRILSLYSAKEPRPERDIRLVRTEI